MIFHFQSHVLQPYYVAWHVIVESFLQEDRNSKMKYHCPPDFGYYETKNGKKQGIKLLTGMYLSKTELPDALRGDITTLAHAVDAATAGIVDSMHGLLGCVIYQQKCSIFLFTRQCFMWAMRTSAIIKDELLRRMGGEGRYS